MPLNGTMGRCLVCQILVPPTWKSPVVSNADTEGGNGVLHDVLVSFGKRSPEAGRRLLDANGDVHRYLAILVDGERVPHNRLRATSVTESSVVQLIPPLVGG